MDGIELKVQFTPERSKGSTGNGQKLRNAFKNPALANYRVQLELKQCVSLDSATFVIYLLK